MKSELNSRQWALYNYLKARGDEWTCQWQIAVEIPDYDYDGESLSAAFHDSTARHLLTRDIQVINKSNVIQKIIISTPQGIKLASESEYEIYIRSQYAALWRKKARLDKIARKANMDGQMRIVLGSERDTIKAFIDSDKDIGERLKTARLKAGLTATEVVWQMPFKGFDAPMLSRFEKGYCLPNRTTLAKLAVIYGVTPEYLLTGNLSHETEMNKNNGLQAVKGGGNA